MSEITGRLSTAIADRYRIERHLGQGGMATVYLAHDVKHDRKVALKVLRPELAAVIGADRFLQEIKVTANLQHPNILPLYDSGEADSFLYYVMPYMEGESLRDKIDREKQLGVEEAVGIIRAVASALDYAHRQGVVHRDIKPENILLQDGNPMVADFGIALAVSHAGGSRLTETGLSIGTPHYMSPEQAMGDRELDARSDIYSLGAMLYELLVGEPPFTGPTAQSIVAKVITEKPPMVSTHRDTVPRHVSLTIYKSLAKLPADRYPSAIAFGEALVRPMTADTDAYPLPPGETIAAPARRFDRLTVTFAVLFVLAALLAAWGWLRPSPPAGVSRLHLNLDPAIALNFGWAFAVSPDGQTVIYRGPQGVLHQRRMDRTEPAPLALTGEARTPFFSPDGRSFAYHHGSPGDDRLYVAQVSGAAPVELVSGVAPGGSWGDDGFIYFRGDAALRDPGIWRVPAAGGEAERLLPEDSAVYWFPEILPGGEAFLATRVPRGGGASTIIAFTPGSGDQKTVVAGGHPRFAAGYLFWVNPDNTLMAAPFDTRRLEMTAPAIPVAAHVVGGPFNSGQYAVSAAGVAVYQTGSTDEGEAVVWVTRDGVETPVAPGGWPEAGGDTDYLALSPDERYLALTFQSGGGTGEQHIWSFDIAQQTVTRLTLDGNDNNSPVWMPDGRTIAFSSQRAETEDIYAVPFDGSGRERLLFQSDADLRSVQWTPDGAAWIVSRREAGQFDLYVGRQGVDTLAPFVATGFEESAPRLSPDGRWVAYVSDQSGRNEVYLRAFPGGGRVWTVSQAGGWAPVWSPSGDELFYVDEQSQLIAVQVSTQPELTFGAREALFSVASYEFRASGAVAIYEVTRDGRFLFIRDPVGEATGVVVVQGLFEELQRARQ